MLAKLPFGKSECLIQFTNHQEVYQGISAAAHGITKGAMLFDGEWKLVDWHCVVLLY